jgi:type I restriction enzyme S subunit
MNAERLLAHFERISEAPDAISRLRRFILDLAVRGKLVEQDPEDEPAEELLCWIQAEKALMEAEGAIRREKQFLPIDQSTTPFTCPPGWTWTHLGAVSLISQGFAFSSALFSKDKSEGLPLVKIGDIGTDCPDVFTQEFPGRSYLVEPGDILLGLSGSIKCSIWSGPQALLNQRIARLKPAINEIPVEWLLMAVGSCINKWKEETSKLTVQNVKAGQLSGAVITLPPLAEQHRIVAKVDELMALCDQLEAARQQRERGRERLMSATLQRLNQPAADPASFRQDASFALQVLPSLSTTPAQIKQLRQTILNLAVRGKLVEQDPEDEPAVDLIRKISEEKPALLAKGGFRSFDGKLNRDGCAFIFGIPSTWEWCFLDDISAIGRGGSPRPIQAFITDSQESMPWIKISDSSRGSVYINNTQERITLAGVSRSRIVVPGDLLLSNSMSFGFSYISMIEGCIHDGWLVIRTPEGLINKLYLRLLLLSDHARAAFAIAASGAVVQNLNADKVRQLAIPLPPLAEQHRIVAKVDELMALCDQLEQQLSQADHQRRRLLEAVLAEALGGRLPTEQEESHAVIA